MTIVTIGSIALATPTRIRININQRTDSISINKISDDGVNSVLDITDTDQNLTTRDTWPNAREVFLIATN
jgi:hypothetical protein